MIWKSDRGGKVGVVWSRDLVQWPQASAARFWHLTAPTPVLPEAGLCSPCLIHMSNFNSFPSKPCFACYPGFLPIATRNKNLFRYWLGLCWIYRSIWRVDVLNSLKSSVPWTQYLFSSLLILIFPSIFSVCFLCKSMFYERFFKYF